MLQKGGTVADEPRTNDRHAETRFVQAIAFAAFALNLILGIGKALLLHRTESLAVTASIVDSATDAVASLAVFVGVLLSTRKTKQFPLGLYKVENVISVVVAIFIFIAGYEIARGALLGAYRQAAVPASAVVIMAVNTLVVFLFGLYARIQGRRTESPSLMAEGHHRQTDALASLAVLVSVTLAYLGVDIRPLGVSIDTIAAVVVLGFIIKAGWDLLTDGMRVLLDAALPPETLNRIRDVAMEEPGVVDVPELYGRSAGRFRFIQLTLEVRPEHLDKAHAVSERVEAKLAEEIPRVERVIVHYEPAATERVIVAVPLQEDGFTVSPHFGEAPRFAFADIQVRAWAIVNTRIETNPHLGLTRQKGLRVAEWLIRHNVDAVAVREDIGARGGGYVLSNAGVNIQVSEVETLDGALAAAKRHYHRRRSIGPPEKEDR
jgi:cation diffusion facilitator family transporter